MCASLLCARLADAVGAWCGLCVRPCACLVEAVLASYGARMGLEGTKGMLAFACCEACCVGLMCALGACTVLCGAVLSAAQKKKHKNTI